MRTRVFFLYIIILLIVIYFFTHTVTRVPGYTASLRSRARSQEPGRCGPTCFCRFSYFLRACFPRANQYCCRKPLPLSGPLRRRDSFSISYFGCFFSPFFLFLRNSSNECNPELQEKWNCDAPERLRLPVSPCKRCCISCCSHLVNSKSSSPLRARPRAAAIGPTRDAAVSMLSCARTRVCVRVRVWV